MKTLSRGFLVAFTATLVMTFYGAPVREALDESQEFVAWVQRILAHTPKSSS
jgi:hypothetical protein